MLLQQAVQNNGSVYLHAFFMPSGFSPDPADPFYKADAVFSKAFRAPSGTSHAPGCMRPPPMLPSLTRHADAPCKA